MFRTRCTVGRTVCERMQRDVWLDLDVWDVVYGKHFKCNRFSHHDSCFVLNHFLVRPNYLIH